MDIAALIIAIIAILIAIGSSARVNELRKALGLS